MTLQTAHLEDYLLPDSQTLLELFGEEDGALESQPEKYFPDNDDEWGMPTLDHFIL